MEKLIGRNKAPLLKRDGNDAEIRGIFSTTTE
jgi:hypothetical protein